MAESPEEAMTRVCDALLAGNFMAIVVELTAEAYADAMGLAPVFAGSTLPQSYKIESHTVEGEDQVFRARFQKAAQEFSGTAVWRQVEGAWKIVSIKLDGVV